MYKDPYQVLGIDRNATDREVKKAYREKSRKYHPDSYQDESEKKWAEEKFREVQEAYQAIVNGTANSQNTYQYGSQDAGYSEEDTHLMAAMNYIRARRYNEAINVLNNMSERSARWYYFSSIANMGLGNNVVALDYAKTAVDMDPGNAEFVNYYQQLQQGGTFQSNPFGGGYGGGFGGYGGYGNYGGGSYGTCSSGDICCDALCLSMVCPCC